MMGEETFVGERAIKTLIERTKVNIKKTADTYGEIRYIKSKRRKNSNCSHLYLICISKPRMKKRLIMLVIQVNTTTHIDIR